MRSGGVPPRGLAGSCSWSAGLRALFGLSRSLSRAFWPVAHCVPRRDTRIASRLASRHFFREDMERRILFVFSARTLGRDAATGTAPTRAPDRRGVAAFFGFRISASPVHREREPRPRQHATGNANASDSARHAVAARRDAPRDPTGHKGHTGSAHGHAGGAVTRCVQAGVRSECRRDAPRPGPAGGGSRLPPCDARIRLPLRITCSWVPVPISFRRIHAIECAHMDILLAAACLSRLSPFSHWLEISFPGRRGWQVRAPRARPRRVNS